MTDMRSFITLVENRMIPQPRKDNIRDAIQHADAYGEGWKPKDFDLEYVGFLTVEEIAAYDDLDNWLETDGEDDIPGFRQGAWAKMPAEDELPPILIITAPDDGDCHTQVGDGRGRVNYANARGFRLHVWHMVFKGCGG